MIMFIISSSWSLQSGSTASCACLLQHRSIPSILTRTPSKPDCDSACMLPNWPTSSHSKTHSHTRSSSSRCPLRVSTGTCGIWESVDQGRILLPRRRKPQPNRRGEFAGEEWAGREERGVGRWSGGVVGWRERGE